MSDRNRSSGGTSAGASIYYDGYQDGWNEALAAVEAEADRAESMRLGLAAEPLRAIIREAVAVVRAGAPVIAAEPS